MKNPFSFLTKFDSKRKPFPIVTENLKIKNFPCQIIRTPIGTYSGFAAINKSHPFYKVPLSVPMKILELPLKQIISEMPEDSWPLNLKIAHEITHSISDQLSFLMKMMQQSDMSVDPSVNIAPTLGTSIIVHKGLGFAGFIQPERNLWWLGFHASYPGDILPIFIDRPKSLNKFPIKLPFELKDMPMPEIEDIDDIEEFTQEMINIGEERTRDYIHNQLEVLIDQLIGFENIHSKGLNNAWQTF